MKRIAIQVSDLAYKALEEKGKPSEMTAAEYLKSLVTSSAMGADIPLELGPIVNRLRAEEDPHIQPRLPLPEA